MNRFLCFYIVLSVGFCLILRHTLLPCLTDGPSGRQLVGDTHYTLEDAESYARLVAEYDGHLEKIRETGVAPSIYSANLPADLSRLPTHQKTSLFISILLPNVILVNQEILEVRHRLEYLLAKKESYARLTSKEQWWLNRLAKRYGCSPDDNRELLLRVDTVPTALAIAQGIDESGWGTSRFALAGNALFGQHLPAAGKGRYIQARRGSAKVAAFDNIYESTTHYIQKLNSVWAYKEFRELRHAMREQGLAFTGHELAGGLERYSALGQRYISDLRYLIKRYKLESLNGVQLGQEDTPLLVQFSR